MNHANCTERKRGQESIIQTEENKEKRIPFDLPIMNCIPKIRVVKESEGLVECIE